MIRSVGLLSGKRSFVSVVIALLCATPGLALAVDENANKKDSPGIQAYKNPSFSPARGEIFPIALTLKNQNLVKRVVAEIRTVDDDVIRQLEANESAINERVVILAWDGKDAIGNIVPDEAYVPTIRVYNKDGTVEQLGDDEDSGGAEVYDFEKSIQKGSIEYTLPIASRVLIRAGIKNGPMLRTVVDWEPRTSGFHAERWNGRDLDSVINIEENPQIGYLIVGYELPKYSIITYGNKDLTYRAYREKLKLPLKNTDYAERKLEREGRLIRQESYMPVLQQKSPRIDIAMRSAETKKPVESVEGFDEVLVDVRINEQDERYLEQERYEITFFVDNQFIAEEEQGFVPFTWRWSPARYGITPGDHVLTVNISGYGGQVGVKNIPFKLSVSGEQ